MRDEVQIEMVSAVNIDVPVVACALAPLRGGAGE